MRPAGWRESLARRLEDQAQVNALFADDFTGPEYELLAGELAAYGYPVILAWIRHGTIWGTAPAGRKVSPNAPEETDHGRPDPLDLRLARGATANFRSDTPQRPDGRDPRRHLDADGDAPAGEAIGDQRDELARLLDLARLDKLDRAALNSALHALGSPIRKSGQPCREHSGSWVTCWTSRYGKSRR